MSKPETLTKVTQIYRQGEKVYKCTDLKKVAADIHAQLGFSKQEEMVYAARRISRPDHLFMGAFSTVQDLMQRGDQVTIWTQGDPENQLFKIAGSGIGSVRKKVSAAERKRFSVEAQMDKVTDIDKTINSLVEKGAEKIVVVDDKAGNIRDVKKRISELKEQGKIPTDLDISILWARYGAYKDKAPTGTTLEDFLAETETIEAISELRRYKSPKGKTGWMLDFDNTLFRTADYNQELYAQTAHQIDGIDGILPVQIGVPAGLSGRVKSAYQVKHGGMSGSDITFVDTGDKRVVVKHNHKNPDRVHDDIEGYHFLAPTPLGEKMPQLESYDEKRGFLVMPHINGRKGKRYKRRGSFKFSTADIRALAAAAAA
jgi:hypothetical protein